MKRLTKELPYDKILCRPANGRLLCVVVTGMQIVSLTTEQIRKIYREEMVLDFPDDERKPLMMILKSRAEGTYACFGAFDSDSLVGYAFYAVHGQDYLLDYLAVVRGMRDRGIGSQILLLLANQLEESASVLVEVEDPRSADTEEEAQLRRRRMRFYIRNGFRDTGVTAWTFGVEYRLLELEKNGCRSEESIRELYRSHYKAMVPKPMYEKNIRV